jgi:hypothetical protein
MSFRIIGLDPTPFHPLFGLSDEELKKHGALRYMVDHKPGFPDRIEVRDAEPGETVLLVNYTHQSADTPYRASHAIFVREGAEQAYNRIGEIPEVLRVRLLSVRGFDDAGLMVDADVVDGRELEGVIERFFGNPKIAYLQVHFAKRGCYAARIERV